MNEQLIRDIVDVSANKQVKSLEADLESLNKKFQDVIVSKKILNDTLSQSKGLSDFNKNTEAVNKSNENGLKLVAQRQLAEEKLAAFKANEQSKADARAAKELANEQKLTEAINKRADAAKKRSTIISNSQAEIDAYYKSQNSGSGGANPDGTTVNASNLRQAEDTIDAIDRERISIKPYTDEINKNSKATEFNTKTRKLSNLELEKEKIRLAQNAAALKNLAKEQVAEKGSLDQRRAALNRLRVTFDGLSAQERNSPFGQRLAKTIPQLNKQVLDLEQATGRSGRNVGNYGSAFDKVAAGAGKAFGALRFVANILPGVGIAGLIAFAADPIIEYISKLDIFAKKIDELKRRADQIDSVKLLGTQNAQSELITLRLLFTEYTNNNLKLEERERAYKQLQNLYPAYFGNLKFEESASIKAREAYDALSSSILATARARAANEKISEIEKTKLDNETKRIQLERENIKSQRELAKIQKDLDQEFIEGRTKREVALADGGGQQISTAEGAEIAKQKQNLTDRRKLILENNKLTQDQARIEKYARQQMSLGGNLTDIPDPKDPKKPKKEPKGVDPAIQARKDAAAIIQVQIDALKEAQSLYDEQANQQNFSLEGRLNGLKNYQDVSREIIDLEAKKEIASKKVSSEEILAIESDSQKKQVDLSLKGADRVNQITKEGLKRLNDIRVEQNIKDLDSIDRRRDDEISSLTNLYTKGLISQENFNFRKEEIEKAYTAEYISLQIEQTEAYISNLKARGENTDTEETKLAAIRLKFANLAVSDGKDVNQKLIDKAKERFEIEKQIALELFDLTKTLIGRSSELRLNALKDEASAVEEKRNKDIEQVNDSVATEEEKANSIAIINARADSQQKAIDERVRQEKIKQAKAEKAAAIAQALINGALAMTKVAAQTGVLSFAFSPLIAALTAVQIATIIAQPIPKYKGGKGKGDNYSGSAWVGDGGMSELVIEPNGSMWVTPSTPTLTNVSAGTEIISGPDFKRMLAKPNLNSTSGGSSIDLSLLVAEQRKSTDTMVKAFKSQSINSTILTEKGLIRNRSTVGKISEHIGKQFGRRF